MQLALKFRVYSYILFLINPKILLRILWMQPFRKPHRIVLGTHNILVQMVVFTAHCAIEQRPPTVFLQNWGDQPEGILLLRLPLRKYVPIPVHTNDIKVVRTAKFDNAAVLQPDKVLRIVLRVPHHRRA